MSPPGRQAHSSRPRRRRPARRPVRPATRSTSVDFPTRLAAVDAALRAELIQPAVLHRILAALHDSVDPADIGAAAIAAMTGWIPLTSWAVVVGDLAGESSVVAERGIAPEMAVALPGIAAQTFERRETTSQLASAGRFAGSTIVIPLEARGRCFGAIIGFDAAPAPRPARLSMPTWRALLRVIAPVASALDKTLLLKRVEALSVTDDLTRLYNSRYLNQVLRRESKRAIRNRRPLSLLFIDLDGFKLINDTYGHLSGSQALMEAAAVIRGSARETDIAARFGGDEFALILPDTGGDGALSVAERVCDRLASHVFLSEQGLAVRLTASVGVATLPDSAISPEELVQAADSAMYGVKDRGKNGLLAAPLRTDK